MLARWRGKEGAKSRLAASERANGSVPPSLDVHGQAPLVEAVHQQPVQPASDNVRSTPNHPRQARSIIPCIARGARSGGGCTDWGGGGEREERKAAAAAAAATYTGSRAVVAAAPIGWLPWLRSRAGELRCDAGSQPRLGGLAAAQPPAVLRAVSRGRVRRFAPPQLGTGEHWLRRSRNNEVVPRLVCAPPPRKTGTEATHGSSEPSPRESHGFARGAQVSLVRCFPACPPCAGVHRPGADPSRSTAFAHCRKASRTSAVLLLSKALGLWSASAPVPSLCTSAPEEGTASSRRVKRFCAKSPRHEGD